MSVCSPTRISIMTGQNGARHRTTNWINPDQDNTGPQGPRTWNWRGLKRGDVTLPPHRYQTRHAHREMRLASGQGPLTLRALDIPGKSVVGVPRVTLALLE
jgi:hypothetical protein